VLQKEEYNSTKHKSSILPMENNQKLLLQRAGANIYKSYLGNYLVCEFISLFVRSIASHPYWNFLVLIMKTD
jgi:hypothetical protein